MSWLDTIAARRLAKKAQAARQVAATTNRALIDAKVAQLRREKNLPPIAGQRPHRLAL